LIAISEAARWGGFAQSGFNRCRNPSLDQGDADIFAIS
jgi:hypothetical protein